MNNRVEKMTVRFASAEDWERVADLEWQCFPAAEAVPRKAFAERLSRVPESCWLLEDEGVLAASVNGIPTNEKNLLDRMYETTEHYDPDGPWFMVLGVNTSPEYRGLGCASRLIKHMIEEVSAKEKKGLVLTCKSHLLSYYDGFGFENEGRSESTLGGARWYQMRLTF